MTLNYLIWLFVKPSHIVFIVLIVGVVLWRTRFGRWCRNVGCVLIVVLGLLPAGSLLIRPLEQRFGHPPPGARPDGIIVLAGSERRGLSEVTGQPQLDEAGDRLTTILMLAGRYPDARLAHSGRPAETAVAASIILGAGVDAERIVFDDQSTNTCASAVSLKKLLAPRPGETWWLVTTASHMPRSVACFRAQDWDVIAYPADYRSGPNPFHFGLVRNFETLDYATHEWLGLAYYRLLGKTDELLPAP